MICLPSTPISTETGHTLSTHLRKHSLASRSPLSDQPLTEQGEGLHGYISVNVSAPPPGYGYGVSLYSAAWPLLERPIAGFQIGLCSTWILPDNHAITYPLVPHGTEARDTMPERGPSFWTVFQTIEGGLGFWASNKFLGKTAKFRMNGSVDGYNHEVSTPGWEFSGKPLPGNEMGIAQLSNHILVPPDGVTFDQKTFGQLFGYAWMALPLIPPTSTPVPTGNQCWTSFFNTKNFRGPVAFYLPVAWTRMSRNYKPAVGRGLDALPGIADSGAIEVNTVPEFSETDATGAIFTKIPQLRFPADDNGETVLLHKLTVYSKAALWNQVVAWENGGPTPSGEFNPAGAYVPKVNADPLGFDLGGSQNKVGSLSAWLSTATLDDHTFGLQWQKAALTPWKSGYWKGSFPAYFKKTGKTFDPILASDLPAGLEITKAEFTPADESQSYLPSENGEGVWKHPGPVAGPFKAKLTDGSVVTYYWYRFIDQPSLQFAGLSLTEKRKLQALVVKIQRNWTSAKHYMASPDRGELATLDPALLVTPPLGLEYGYVPVAFQQSPRETP